MGRVELHVLDEAVAQRLLAQLAALRRVLRQAVGEAVGACVAVQLGQEEARRPAAC